MPIKLEYSHIENTRIKKFYNRLPRHVTAYLDGAGEPTSIHCMYCKNKLFECQHNLAQVSPGAPPMEIKHLKIKCSNPGCNTFWYFISVV